VHCRCALVFLDDSSQVDLFEEYFQAMKAAGGVTYLDHVELNCMRPSDSNAMRSVAVRAACQPNRVTICTRDFGRGVDFVVYSEAVIQEGGMHVIQAFLSTEYCEEIQIQGRTCRQDNPGSYALVVTLEDLERQLDLEDDSLVGSLFTGNGDTDASVYAKLHQRRVEVYDQNYYETVTSNKGLLLSNHTKSLAFVDALQSKKTLDQVTRFLLEENSTEPALSLEHLLQAQVHVSRTAILLDATRSMTCMLDNTKSTIVEMVGDIRAILEEKQVSGNFQIKFYVYRNYGSGPELVVEESDWNFTLQQQKAFLDRIVVQGGQKREAIEAALQLVNDDIEKGFEVTQILLIGDAGPNDDAPSEKREGRNEIENSRCWYLRDRPELPGNMWEFTRFPKATTFKAEFDKIRRYHIPMRTFFVQPLATSGVNDPLLSQYKLQFQQFANESGGTYHLLQNNSTERDRREYVLQISEAILRDVDADRGQELVDAFKSRVESSYAR
jgi:hypothetical protein